MPRHQGFCQKDLWNLDYFYCKMFVKTLTAFCGKEGPVSYPGCMTYEKWNSTLHEMIACFQFQIDHADDDRVIIEKDKQLKRGFYLLKKYFHHLWY